MEGKLSEPVSMTLLLLGLLLPIAAASKILIMPNQESSHIRAMSYVGRGLAEHGHQVTITVRYSQKQGPGVIGKMEQLLWGDPNEKTYFSGSPEESERFMKYYIASKNMESALYSVFEWPKIHCELLLQDTTLYNEIKARKFDLIIVDGLHVTRCNYIFIHGLGIPYISQTAIFPHDLALFSQYLNNPFTTSNQFTFPDMTNTHSNDVGKMTFIQRTSNAISLIFLNWALRYQTYGQSELFKKYARDRPLDKSLSQLAAESKLWLVEQHPVLDFPRPMYGTVKYIGGMNWKASKQLTGKYAEFAKEEFVVVSLGGDLLYMQKGLGDELAAAFEKMPQYKFIWANKGELTNPTPKNVMKVDWMPQNDLVGHKNCKLFVTHCGNNGQFEAVGHGVPMLGVPIMRDQPSNAWRMIEKGYGLAVHLNSVTTAELVEKITEIITNPKYKENIMRARAIFHDAPRTPTEEAVYWVEHVLKHGTDYLKSDAMSMPWYQVLGYDIVGFLAFVLVVTIVIINKLIRCLWSRTKSTLTMLTDKSKND